MARSRAAEVPVVRAVLRLQAKEVIARRILDGTYEPGERLVETQIARELRVSQGSVREALRGLESVGLVEYTPFRGSRVSQPTREEILDAFPVRAALESLAAAEAAVRLGKSRLGELAALIHEMEDAAVADDGHGLSLADARFHRLIVESAGNATLSRHWQLLEPFARTYYTVAHSSLDLAVLAARHLPILDALREGDPVAAAFAVRMHLDEAARSLTLNSTKEQR